jgi:DNA polymerase IV
MKDEEYYMHIDVNNAFLSFEAADRNQHGAEIDLRSIPSVVGGSEKTRHGIVLAKSDPAKRFGVKTGESLMEARQKAPNLTVVPPRYKVYVRASNAMIDFLSRYSPDILQFSIDEVFMNYTGCPIYDGNIYNTGKKISRELREELGFTVNIGISSNMLLAKMASELEKPNKVHTIFPSEIQEKMWILPIQDLYMCGYRTASKLKRIGINTIGDLAKSDRLVIKTLLKSHGSMLWNFANGIYKDTGKGGAGNFQGMMVFSDNTAFATKGVGNSTTISFDVTDASTAKKVLLSLSEMVGSRLREKGFVASNMSVSFADNEFARYRKQHKFPSASNDTNEIYHRVSYLFDKLWADQPIRQIGIKASALINSNHVQVSIFDDDNMFKRMELTKTIDELRNKYGRNSIFRCQFLDEEISPMIGGPDDNKHKRDGFRVDL